MGKITIVLPDKTEKSFRRMVGITKGSQKGALGECFAEAAEMWITKNSHSNLNRFLQTPRRK